MPGSTIHLMMAKKIEPEPSALFFIGNIVPDAVEARGDKDITHFRSVPDREKAMEHLRGSTDPKDDFAEGVLLHFYLDWQWDADMILPYKSSGGADWFPKYRAELRLAGSYGYRQTPWLWPVWDAMTAVGASEYGFLERATNEEAYAFVQRNRQWFLDNDIGPSEVYTPEIIENYLNETAEKYVLWRGLTV